MNVVSGFSPNRSVQLQLCWTTSRQGGGRKPLSGSVSLGFRRLRALHRPTPSAKIPPDHMTFAIPTVKTIQKGDSKGIQSFQVEYEFQCERKGSFSHHLLVEGVAREQIQPLFLVRK